MSREAGWYVTAAQRMYSRDQEVQRPLTPPHLKRLGVSITACGLPTHTWTTFWLEDPTGTSGLCGECVNTVRSITERERSEAAAEAERREQAARRAAQRFAEARRKQALARRGSRPAPMDATGMVLPPRSVRSGRRRA
ncbi:hypothetical protein PD653_1122 [Nocardioides sp. PD653]|nr:hypothetical protein PD653B2_0289 [Nocardioides sp. PD653-B2]GAW53719.1 hypothetical protein PD653_1122 [Nocardioides sp. PD653]